MREPVRFTYLVLVSGTNQTNDTRSFAVHTRYVSLISSPGRGGKPGVFHGDDFLSGGEGLTGLIAPPGRHSCALLTSPRSSELRDLSSEMFDESDQVSGISGLEKCQVTCRIESNDISGRQDRKMMVAHHNMEWKG